MSTPDAAPAPVSEDAVERASKVLWASVDDKGIRGRLYRAACTYLAEVLAAAGLLVSSVPQLALQATQREDAIDREAGPQEREQTLSPGPASSPEDRPHDETHNGQAEHELRVPDAIGKLLPTAGGVVGVHPSRLPHTTSLRITPADETAGEEAIDRAWVAMQEHRPLSPRGCVCGWDDDGRLPHSRHAVESALAAAALAAPVSSSADTAEQIAQAIEARWEADRWVWHHTVKDVYDLCARIAREHATPSPVAATSEEER